MPTAPDVRKLIELALSGDDEAQRAVHGRCRIPIEQSIRAVLGSKYCEDDHQEVAQLTYTDLFGALENFRFDCALASFVARIARFKALSYVRKFPPVGEPLDPHDDESPESRIVDPDPDPEQVMVVRQEYDRLAMYLELHLTARDFQGFRLRFQEGCEEEEMAQRLKATPAAITQMIHRIRTAARHFRRT